MNDLEKYFYEHRETGPLIEKPKHFLIIYGELLEPYRNKEMILVEVGLGSGACLKMWKHFLGPKARIYGIDFKDRSSFNDEQINTLILDQGDSSFAKKLIDRIPTPIDFFIDDGSHICSHQIMTFEAVFPYITKGGVYVCEDTHTSYRDFYGGGYRRPGTFVEYCKVLFDAMHFSEDKQIPVPNSAALISSITIYRTMAVIRKIRGENPNV